MRPFPLDDQYPTGQKFWMGYSNTVDIALKDNCSISDPVFKLLGFSYANGGQIYSCNYIYVPDMGRGYWVHNWEWDNGVWTADCHVDVLGSFDLPTTPQYVLRSSEEFDGSIKDDYYPVTANVTSGATGWSWPFATNTTQGRFILGIINSTGGAYGSISYYVLTNTQLNTLIQQLMSNIDYMGISADEVSVELQKGLINPMQYIKSCMWVPYVPSLGAAVSSVECGWWSFAISGYKLGAPRTVVESDVYTFDWHPQIDRGTWLMQSPTASLTLNAMPWGLIDLPLDKFTFAPIWEAGLKPRVSYTVYADAISGLAALEVRAYGYDNGKWGGNVIACMTTQLGVPIALAQSSQDVYGGIMSTVNGAVQGAQSAMSAPSTSLDKLTFGASRVVKTATATAIGAGVGLANAIPGLTPSISSVGTSGSYINVGWRWQLIWRYTLVSEDNNRLNGRPLCKSRILPEMGGYVQVLNPDCTSTGQKFPPSDVEVQELNYYLSQGIYIEGII